MIKSSGLRRSKLMLFPASFLLATLMLIGHSLSAQSAGIDVGTSYCGYNADLAKAPATTRSNLCLIRNSRRENAYTPWCAKFGSLCVSMPFASIEATGR